MKYNPTVRIIFDRKKRSKISGVGSVEIEISYAKKRKWIATGVRCAPRNWQNSFGVVNHPDAFLKNQMIFSLQKRIIEYIVLSSTDEKGFSFEGLTCHLSKEKFSKSFIKFMGKCIDERNSISENTRLCHLAAFSVLKRYGKLQLFSDFTKGNVYDYDQWLHKQGLKQSTIHQYHNVLKVYIHEAMNRRLIQEDPYMGLRIDSGRASIRKYLTTEEILKIKSCELPDKLQDARDLFLFQYYTGLAYVDMMHFDFSKVIERDGKYLFVEERRKTEAPFYIVLMNPAAEILKKYDFVLPDIAWRLYSYKLKCIASLSGIGKNVTSHMARHSYAVNALNSGIPIEVVSKMLGHTNINTTQIYAKVLNKTIDAAFDQLESKLKDDGF